MIYILKKDNKKKGKLNKWKTENKPERESPDTKQNEFPYKNTKSNTQESKQPGDGSV